MDNFTEEDKEHSIDVASDAGALEEVLRMILEIINSTLISQNKSNSNFIYTLLYQQHIFEPFHKHPNFQDLLQNIKTVSVIQKMSTVIHYLENKVGVVDFANAQGLVMFESPRALGL